MSAVRTRPDAPASGGERLGREFARLPMDNEPWRDVLHLARAVNYAPGEIVIQEDTPSEFLYFLDHGEVRMLCSAPCGLEKTLWYVDPDHLFGETPLLDGRRNRNRHVCTQPSRIHAFRRAVVLEEIFPSRPDLVLNLLRTLAGKVRMLSNQIARLSLDDLPARICTYLSLHARPESAGDGSRELLLRPLLNQQELATLLGVHRVTLNRALRDLEHEGVLGPYRKSGVLVLDRTRFLAYAKG